MRVSCAVVSSVLILVVLASIGVIAFTASTALRHLAGLSGPSSSPSDSNIVEPPTLYLKVVQPGVTPYAGPKRRAGFDVSFPQCGKVLPSTRGGFAIVGMAGGVPMTRNKCRGDQWTWAQQQSAAAVYVNTADPGNNDATAWGKQMGFSALFGIRDTGVPKGTPVWLDVETENVWDGSWQHHVTVLQAMAQTIADAGYPVGIYSNANLWYRITGNAIVNVPTWYATGPGTEKKALTACGVEGFGGTKPDMVQWVEKVDAGYLLDHNAFCPATSATGLVRRTGNTSLYPSAARSLVGRFDVQQLVWRTRTDVGDRIGSRDPDDGVSHRRRRRIRMIL